MYSILNVLNLNTFNKVLKAWFFFVVLSIFLSFSAVEEHFNRTDIKTTRVQSILCLNGASFASHTKSASKIDLLFNTALGASSERHQKVSFDKQVFKLLLSFTSKLKNTCGACIFNQNLALKSDRAPPAL